MTKTCNWRILLAQKAEIDNREGHLDQGKRFKRNLPLKETGLRGSGGPSWVARMGGEHLVVD